MVDNLVRSHYGEAWEQAVKGTCDHWTKTHRGLVALVILLDQFTRNMYRDTPKMFEGDAKCYEIVKKAIQDGVDMKLPLFQRFWLYTALTRQEDLKVQEQNVAYMEQQFKDAPTKNKNFFQTGSKFATSQYELIKKFGRFPNRNAVLGRQNTEEEAKYLASDNKAFST